MTALTALIPARGGSKGVPRKNIRELAGYPLLAYSIIACKKCTNINRVVVSTDDDEIAAVAIQYGAEVPFLRPEKYAQDNSTDLDVITHFYSIEGAQDLAFIRPTTPLRKPKVMDILIKDYFMHRDTISGMRSAHELPESPYKFFKIVDGIFTGFFDEYNGIKEYTNLPRQVFPKAYHPNGYIDILKQETVLQGSDFGSRIMPAITEYVVEVDDKYHFNLLESQIQMGDDMLIQELQSDTY
jgi:CMP-N,N'-diacetyllegionaminic acid synthase